MKGLQKTNDVSLSIGNLAVAWHRSNDAVAERAVRLPQTLKFHSARRRPTRQSIGLKFETNCSFTSIIYLASHFLTDLKMIYAKDYRVLNTYAYV